jgi:hypothetical protein
MSYVRGKALSVALLMFCPLVAGINVASADPNDPAPVDPVTAAEPANPAMTAVDQPLAGPLPGPADSLVPNDAVAMACKQFAVALNVASSNYEDFAYASAGGGNFVDYQDPNVARTALIARTALRESGAAALSSAQTPGLPQEVSDPMRSWSLRATKLSFILSLRGGGDSMNATVSDMNTDGHDAQMACALANIYG